MSVRSSSRRSKRLAHKAYVFTLPAYCYCFHRI